MKIMGFTKGVFTSKSGERIPWAKVYASAPLETRSKDVYCEGERCEVYKCTPESLDGVMVGDEVEFAFNAYGKVILINPAV